MTLFMQQLVNRFRRNPRPVTINTTATRDYYAEAREAVRYAAEPNSKRSKVHFTEVTR